MSNDNLRKIITSANTWFIENQEDSGHFKYEYVPYEDEYLNGDNIVRQAGALYALGEITRRDKERKIATRDTIKNAISFFKSLSMKDDRDEYAFRCIVENSNSSKCKLGATSLALSGILGYLQEYPEETNEYESLIESYVTYILKMKKPNAGFKNTHRLDRNSQYLSESSFSNGESLMALVRYYQWNPRENVKEVIDETFEYLSSKPYDTALYLWMMAALKDMYELWEKDEYITYGKDFTDWRVKEAFRAKNTKRNYCAYSEGIVSAYSFLKNNINQIDQENLRAEIAYWNNKNKILQLDKEDQYRLLQENDTLVIKKLKQQKKAIGGFLTEESEPTERIDFTQHCIGAYVQTLVDINDSSL